jgi:hypothetical protein
MSLWAEDEAVDGTPGIGAEYKLSRHEVDECHGQQGRAPGQYMVMLPLCSSEDVFPGAVLGPEMKLTLRTRVQVFDKWRFQ